jgi:hypothetical protein
MGVDYTAIAVIGVRYSRAELEEKQGPKPVKEQISGCKHKHSHKFCPECGKPAYQDVIANQKAIDEFYINDELERILKDLPIRAEYGTDQGYFYIGMVSKTGSSNGGFVNDDHCTGMGGPDQRITAIVKGFLEKVNLWDSARFGLWAVLHCSY